MTSGGVKVLCSGSWGNFSASFGNPLKGGVESVKSKGVSKTATVAASVLAAAGGLLAHFGPELLFGAIGSSSATVIALSVVGVLLALVLAAIVFRSCRKSSRREVEPSFKEEELLDVQKVDSSEVQKNKKKRRKRRPVRVLSLASRKMRKANRKKAFKEAEFLSQKMREEEKITEELEEGELERLFLVREEDLLKLIAHYEIEEGVLDGLFSLG
ncbi:hypothetical protein [Chlamydiifrater phoenicopteri]|uniref:hypothetical protein n=1 Tax=Chlamydiifrater phoenicopteri TaxID=2681469 RepID=UPI001BCD3698|nr:hypothetical protein [Chlamydiifrater phoenicopteri]